MNYYAALDVSLRSVHLCVMDEAGEIQAEGHEDITTPLRPMRAAPGLGPVTDCVEKLNPRINVTQRMP